MNYLYEVDLTDEYGHMTTFQSEVECRLDQIVRRAVNEATTKLGIFAQRSDYTVTRLLVTAKKPEIKTND